MANRMIDPWAPMRQAQQGLNRALVQAPQIRQQRQRGELQNQLSRLQLQQQQAGMQQQQGLQDYMQQRRQQIPQQNRLLQQRAEGIRSTPPHAGLPEDKRQNRIAGLQDQQQQFSPIRAELEYWKQNDPAKYRKIMGKELDNLAKLADINPKAAERRATQDLGLDPANISKDSATGEITIVKQDGTEVSGSAVDVGKFMQANLEDPPQSDAELYQRAPKFNVSFKKPGEEDLSAKEKEIQRYLDRGIVQNRAEAVKLAEGLYRLKEGPFGVELWDLSTGQRIRRSGRGEAGPEGGPGEAGKTGLSQFATVDEVEQVYGPVSSAKQLANDVFGWAVPGQIFPETEQSRNKVRILNQRLTPFFQVSERGAQWDMNRIDEILFKPATFKDPDAAKDKVNNLMNMIDITIQNKRGILESEDLTPDQVKQFSNDIGKLYTAKAIIPKPKEVDELNFSNMDIQRIKQVNTKDLTADQRQALEQRVDELLEQQTQ